VINAIGKMKIASGVEQAKILFVCQQGSIEATGGYGLSFKLALDKNAQFMKDISHFQDSMGMVITKADYDNDEVLEDSIKKI